MSDARKFHLLVTAACAAAIALAAFSGARADVTIKEKTKFDGFGGSGWGASESTHDIIVSGDRLRDETATKFTGKLMKRFSGEEGSKSANITRLDRKLFYMVNYADKSYQEVPFASFEEMQDEMMKSLSGPEEPEAKEEPKLKCQPVKLEAKRTGEKETIAGFSAERVVVTGKQTCENLETKKTCDVLYTMEHWKTPMTSAFQEVEAFHRRQAEAMGIDAAKMQQVAGAARAMMGQGTEGLEAVAKELGKVEGYPVRTRMTIENDGDCGSAQGGQGGRQDSSAAMKDALKGLFGKKKSGSGEGEGKKADAKGESGSGPQKIFGMHSEVTSVVSAGAGADAFEPPAGFKKVEQEKPSRTR